MECRSLGTADEGKNPQAKTETGETRQGPCELGPDQNIHEYSAAFLGGSELRIRGARKKETNLDRKGGRGRVSTLDFRDPKAQIGRARSRCIEPTTGNRNESLPNSSATPLRSGALMAADELSDTADLIKCPRAPKSSQPEEIAERLLLSGFSCPGHLMDV